MIVLYYAGEQEEGGEPWVSERLDLLTGCEIP